MHHQKQTFKVFLCSILNLEGEGGSWKGGEGEKPEWGGRKKAACDNY